MGSDVCIGDEYSLFTLACRYESVLLLCVLVHVGVSSPYAHRNEGVLLLGMWEYG